VVAIILVIALTVMVNWISGRQWVRADWTSTQIYTLSEKTENILAGLDEDIEVVVFMTAATSMYDQVFELLERYKAASPRLSVQYIDPDKEPLKTRQLAEQFGVSVADTVVFSAGERSKYVTSDQITEMDYSGMQYGQAPTMKAFKGEEAFTSAILSLVASTVPKVYFVTGHGEAALGATGGGAAERGLTVLAEMLKRENMETGDTSLLSGEVPEDADIVAVVGPTTALTDAEIEALDAYLEGGGRLLVALDPLIDPDGSMRPTRLEGFLARHGVAVGDDLVIDPSKRLPFYDLSAVYLDDFPSHPVTEGLEGFAVLLTVARSVSADDDTARVVIQTSGEGWGETDLAMLLRGEPVAFGGEDLAGPVGVGVVVERAVAVEAPDVDTETPSDGYRLAVFGDSDFLTDLDIANAGNGVLAANTFNWLGARDEQVGIPPRDVEQVSLFLTQQQMRMLLLIVLVLMPGTAIVAGILVWRRRRH
jgi:hypothetical protein